MIGSVVAKSGFSKLSPPYGMASGRFGHIKLHGLDVLSYAQSLRSEVLHGSMDGMGAMGGDEVGV